MNIFDVLFNKKKNDTSTCSKANKHDAYTRLSSAGRLPINIWGDVMLNGSSPQVRRVLVGKEAHECLLSFFYLHEILTLGDAIKIIENQSCNSDQNITVTQKYQNLKNLCPDPEHQLTQELLLVFVPCALFFKLVGENNTEFCELGCTFFSAIQKMKICSLLINAKIDFNKIKFSAIDHSDFFLKGSTFFHHKDRVISYLDLKDWQPSSKYPFHLSRFVASYAVNSSDEFAEFLSLFSAFHIIDVINLELEDFHTSNNGLNQVFFNFPQMIDSLVRAGWDVYLNEATEDYNAGKRCAVIKIFGVRKELGGEILFLKKLREFEDLQNLLPMKQMTFETALLLVKGLNSALTPTQWEALAEYKKHFPIWGKPERPMNSLKDVEKYIKHPSNELNLSFHGGQINALVRKELNL